MLGIVGGGIGASPDVVIVAMVEGVIISVGVSRDTMREDVVIKIDSTPTSLISTSLSCLASVLWTSVGSTGVVALKGCFPLAVADSRRADSTVVVGVRVGGV
nr:hypothetical protein [Tanacetum cinerariifolium]